MPVLFFMTKTRLRLNGVVLLVLQNADYGGLFFVQYRYAPPGHCTAVRRSVTPGERSVTRGCCSAGRHTIGPTARPVKRSATVNCNERIQPPENRINTPEPPD